MNELNDLTVEELRVLVEAPRTSLYVVLEKLYSARSDTASKELLKHMPALDGSNMGNFTDGDFMFIGGRRKQVMQAEDFRELPVIAAKILKNRTTGEKVA